jgi:hypothetical protein
MSSVADRVAAHRARRKVGQVVLLVEIDETEVTDFLVSSRLLDPFDIEDRAAIGKALSDLIDKITKEKL